MNSVPCVAADIATLVVHNSVSSVHGTSVGYLGPNAAARGVCIRAGTKPSQSDSPFIAVAASYLLSGSMTEASQDGELPSLNPYRKMCPYSCKCTTHVNLNQEFGATWHLQWRVGEQALWPCAWRGRVARSRTWPASGRGKRSQDLVSRLSVCRPGVDLGTTRRMIEFLVLC